MGIRRRDSGSFNYCSYFSSIVFTNIKDIPPIPKTKLIQNPAKYFLFGSELTLWDSLYKDIIGIKGLLFLYPSEVDGAKEWRRRPTRHIQIHRHTAKKIDCEKTLLKRILYLLMVSF